MKESMTTLVSTTIVHLTEDCFKRALERYIDDNKPDRHVRQQMESWKLQWNGAEASYKEKLTSGAAVFVPTHFVAGELIWTAEYMEIKLSVECYWEGTRKDGSIHFQCDVVQGQFTDAPSSPDDKAAKNVHRKMIQRLKQDDYIQKLIKTKQNLIEATVKIKGTGELEERVYCDETTAEAIRRGLFTTGESSLDVFDWIVSLPILPSCAHEGCLTVTTPLADRVKLRCLEEATYDACEQQEEEELVDDLHISKKKKNN